MIDELIDRWKRTCDACPTQYDIWLKDGTYVYFRYRHGRWSISVDFHGGDDVVSGDLGDPLDGYLPHEEVWKILEAELPAALVMAGMRRFEL